MNASDFAALRRGGWVVVNADGSTYNSAALMRVMWWHVFGLMAAIARQQGRARVIAMPRQLCMFETLGETA